MCERSSGPDRSAKHHPSSGESHLAREHRVVSASQLYEGAYRKRSADKSQQRAELVRQRNRVADSSAKERRHKPSRERGNRSHTPQKSADRHRLKGARDPLRVLRSRERLAVDVERLDERSHDRESALGASPVYGKAAQDIPTSHAMQFVSDGDELGHEGRAYPRRVQQIAALKQNIASVFLGNPHAIDRIVICLLARGHVLVEDVPGVGKTVLAQALSRSVHCSFGRIQCTPDLLPSDITGVAILQRDTSAFLFRRGPVFANIVLADEINRATPRTQSALLEAMAEATVSAEGEVHHLPAPFMVIATQNPHEFEGTYLLPENQLDRFLMRIELGYPSAADESRIIQQQPSRTALHSLTPVMDADDVLKLQIEVDKVRIDQTLVDVIIAIAHATREHPDLDLGVSPRGALAMAQVARAAARCSDRDFVVPEDIIDHAIAVCAHRVVPRVVGALEPATVATRILREIMDAIPSPV